MAGRRRRKQEATGGRGAEERAKRKAPGRQSRRGDQAGQFPVASIGASAGGLEAFGALFNDMPGDTGMAFILTQHIEPSHVANMVSLIQKQTRMFAGCEWMARANSGYCSPCRT